MTGRWPALGPAEVIVLLDDATPPHDALRLALTSLIAKGVLGFDAVEQTGMSGTRRIRVLRRSGPATDATPAEAAILAAIGADAAPRTIREAVHALQVAFGPGFREFRDDHLLPDLVRRGLLLARRERFLLAFSRTRHGRTPSGEAERDRVIALTKGLGPLSPVLAGTAAEALAIVAGLGAAIPPIEALRHALAELRDLFRPLFGDDGAPEEGGGPDGGDVLALLDGIWTLSRVLDGGGDGK